MRFVKSLRFRIFLITVLVSFVPTLLMRYGILQSYEQRAVSLRTMEVQDQITVIANHLANTHYLQDSGQQTINAELTQLSALYDGRVLIVDGNYKIIKDTYGISEGKTMISESVLRCFLGQNMSNYDGENQFIEFTVPIMEAEEIVAPDGTKESGGKDADPVIAGIMLTSVSTANIAASINAMNENAAVLQILMLLFVTALAWFMSKLMVRPLNRVTTAIHDVKNGFETSAIPVNDTLETEHIITAFNELLGRMRILDESRQEFVSNVSHELKTPITSMKVLADSLLAQEDAPLELYKDFMADIADEIDRENKIITDLLSLVKMDKTSTDLNIEETDINALLEHLLKRLRPIAEQKDIDLIFESNRQVSAAVDEVKLSLALSNLIENGVKYNREHGYVRVALDADHQFFTVEIEDNGMGIPEESKEHIFERFYRVDKSHSNQIGGNGLGLAITRNAILMHRGSISVESEVGKGTTFFVKIPLYYTQTKQ